MHAQLAIDDSIRIVAHSCCPYGVAKAACPGAHEIDDILLALGLWTWDELGFANPGERFLIHQFSSGLRAPQGRIKITVGAQKIRFENRRIAPIGAYQPHPSAACRLNQRW